MSKDKGTTKPWAGRFAEATAPVVDAFQASVGFDRRLAGYDIRGSMAHARMLRSKGLLGDDELAAIENGLGEIRGEIEAGTFVWDQALEDVHMNIEARLIEKIGDPGGKLHTGRSRNDQVALDFRMYVRDHLDLIRDLVRDLRRAVVYLARDNLTLVMPGYTHLQRAQPILLAHHLLAYEEMLRRDDERLRDCRTRLNVSPLGAGALAGAGFDLDPGMVAAELGFEAAFDNSLDAVSDRDFAVEFLAALALIMVHLSRLGEELVLWSSSEFGFVRLPDTFATGSSLMPQKKNPDVPELVRAKAGRVFGDLTALLTVLKGLPLAYNKDLQEDKEAVFDAVDTTQACLTVLTPMLAALEFDGDRMAAATEDGFLTATDLADYLVEKGVPFREAHEVVGRAVALAVERGCSLGDLDLDALIELSPLVSEEVYEVLKVENSLARRRLPGGTAPVRVLEKLEAAEKRLWPEN
ncbi:MAG: argininosuccinate lyase [Proteobacteria bacterium]|nr:argininosuccinate lyase [Pseudomonadota bacterium]